MDATGSGSGTRLLKVIRNKCGKVVPKAAPSTPDVFPVRLLRMGGGWYTCEHFGQYIFTVSTPISSLSPTGRTGWPAHCTRGHAPNSLAAYCEFWESTTGIVSIGVDVSKARFPRRFCSVAATRTHHTNTHTYLGIHGIQTMRSYDISGMNQTV